MHYVKGQVWDVRVLGVEVPLDKMGSHLPVRVDEWSSQRRRLPSAKLVGRKKGNLFTYLAQATQQTDLNDLCFDSFNDSEVDPVDDVVNTAPGI